MARQCLLDVNIETDKHKKDYRHNHNEALTSPSSVSRVRSLECQAESLRETIEALEKQKAINEKLTLLPNEVDDENDDNDDGNNEDFNEVSLLDHQHEQQPQNRFTKPIQSATLAAVEINDELIAKTGTVADYDDGNNRLSLIELFLCWLHKRCKSVPKMTLAIPSSSSPLSLSSVALAAQADAVAAAPEKINFQSTSLSDCPKRPVIPNDDDTHCVSVFAVSVSLYELQVRNLEDVLLFGIVLFYTF